VLIVTEEVADWLGDDLTAWQLSGKYPLVVDIPGLMGKLEGRKTLVDAIREASVCAYRMFLIWKKYDQPRL